MADFRSSLFSLEKGNNNPMAKIIETKIGTLNYEEYPIIRFTSREVESDILMNDIDDFIAKLRHILNTTEGPFVFFGDTKEYSWPNSEFRDYFGVSVQALESGYLDRHKGSYIYVSNVLAYLLVKILFDFVKSHVPVKISFNKLKITAEVEAYSSKLINSKLD